MQGVRSERRLCRRKVVFSRPPTLPSCRGLCMYIYMYVCMRMCVCVCVCVCVFVLPIHIYIIPVQGTPWRELTPIRNNDVKSQRYLNQFPNTWQPAERLAEQRSQQSPKVSFAVQ